VSTRVVMAVKGATGVRFGNLGEKEERYTRDVSTTGRGGRGRRKPRSGENWGKTSFNKPDGTGSWIIVKEKRLGVVANRIKAKLGIEPLRVPIKAHTKKKTICKIKKMDKGREWSKQGSLVIVSRKNTKMLPAEIKTDTRRHAVGRKAGTRLNRS